ncbi:acyl carrier protein [Streptomyces longwoodensis]|uniref:acyl carrier protein n=1 Tax=Streptomyces longwoodensis TaxID=68231 RepID=UPI0033C3D639
MVQELGISHAQPTDNFSASGGQSLTVAKLAIELSKEFGRRVPLRTIYDHPTLEELTVYMSGQTATPEPLKREAGTVQGTAPLTPQQASAFNAHLRAPDTTSSTRRPPSWWTERSTTR